MRKEKAYDIKTNNGNLRVMKGGIYKAIGCCGMKEDKVVIGELREIVPAHQEAILVDDTGTPCMVNLKTIEVVDSDGRRMRLIRYVQKYHKNQKRKYTSEPYFNHCRAVAVLSGTYLLPSEPLAWEVGLCHDLFEDTKCHYVMFSNDLVDIGYDLIDAATIAGTVNELSAEYTPERFPKLNRKQRKIYEGIRMNRASKLAQSVKCADLINNTKSIIKHDKKFAVIYLKEKIMLLDKMRKADISIYIECCYVLKIAMLELEKWVMVNSL